MECLPAWRISRYDRELSLPSFVHRKASSFFYPCPVGVYPWLTSSESGTKSRKGRAYAWGSTHHTPAASSEKKAADSVRAHLLIELSQEVYGSAQPAEGWVQDKAQDPRHPRTRPGKAGRASASSAVACSVTHAARLAGHRWRASGDDSACPHPGPIVCWGTPGGVHTCHLHRTLPGHLVRRPVRPSTIGCPCLPGSSGGADFGSDDIVGWTNVSSRPGSSRQLEAVQDVPRVSLLAAWLLPRR